jgi:hypothetical protein
MQTRVLEIIHLRLAAHRPELVAELAREVGQAGGGEELRVYRHSRVETDLLVQMHRDVPAGSESPSRRGSQLASLLREHGLVEHSVWVQQAGSEATTRSDGGSGEPATPDATGRT